MSERVAAAEEAKYFNRILWTDVIPFEVVRRVSGKTIEIREMDAMTVRQATLLGVGGFAAVWASDEEYAYKSNESHPIIRIRLHKDGWWRCCNGNKYRPSHSPEKVYDRSF